MNLMPAPGQIRPATNIPKPLVPRGGIYTEEQRRQRLQAIKEAIKAAKTDVEKKKLAEDTIKTS